MIGRFPIPRRTRLVSSSSQAAPPSSLVRTRPRASIRESSIISPAQDLLYFVLSPLLGVVAFGILAFYAFEWAASPRTIFGVQDSRVGFFGAVWTFSHLFAVFFRSHVDDHVFKQHKIRFTVVPIALFGAFMVSDSLLVIGVALAFFWDIYHSSMQNFGFSRIYDMKMGNPAAKGRTLDMWMNHLVYIGPIFIGLGLRYSLEEGLGGFRHHGWFTLWNAIDPIVAAQREITIALVLVGGAFTVYYVYSFWKFAQEGYQFSTQKALLLITVGGVSTYAWGFREPIYGMLIVNFFHGLQYFAFVWWTERKSIQGAFGLSSVAYGQALAFVGYVLVLLALGLWYRVYSAPGLSHAAISLGIVVSLMHFWYDGFVWSVREARSLSQRAPRAAKRSPLARRPAPSASWAKNESAGRSGIRPKLTGSPTMSAGGGEFREEQAHAVVALVVAHDLDAAEADGRHGDGRPARIGPAHRSAAPAREAQQLGFHGFHDGRRKDEVEQEGAARVDEDRRSRGSRSTPRWSCCP